MAGHAATTCAGTSVVLSAVDIGSSGRALEGGAGEAANDARLLGEVAAAGDTVGHSVVTVALGQPGAHGLVSALLLGGKGVESGLFHGGDAVSARGLGLAVGGAAADTGVGVGLEVLGAGGIRRALGPEWQKDVEAASPGHRGANLEGKGAVDAASAITIKLLLDEASHAGPLGLVVSVLPVNGRALTLAGGGVQLAAIAVVAALESGGKGEGLVIIRRTPGLGRAAHLAGTTADAVQHGGVASEALDDAGAASTPRCGSGVDAALGGGVTLSGARADKRGRRELEVCWLSGHEGDYAGEENNFHSR